MHSLRTSMLHAWVATAIAVASALFWAVPARTEIVVYNSSNDLDSQISLITLTSTEGPEWQTDVDMPVEFINDGPTPILAQPSTALKWTHTSDWEYNCDSSTGIRGTCTRWMGSAVEPFTAEMGSFAMQKPAIIGSTGCTCIAMAELVAGWTFCQSWACAHLRCPPA